MVSLTISGCPVGWAAKNTKGEADDDMGDEVDDDVRGDLNDDVTGDLKDGVRGDVTNDDVTDGLNDDVVGEVAAEDNLGDLRVNECAATDFTASLQQVPDEETGRLHSGNKNRLGSSPLVRRFLPPFLPMDPPDEN